MGGVGKRKVGSGNAQTKKTKVLRRRTFEARHLDLIWEDIRKEAVHSSADKKGPVGNSSVELDTDLPAQGAHYCLPCSRYFVSDQVLQDHSKTKAHKRRVKLLVGDKPHTQKDANKSGGMGAPDNGKPRTAPAAVQRPTAMEATPAVPNAQIAGLTI
eukprot:jgi/Astpho2/2252/e_gw1.00040.162.1_t